MLINLKQLNGNKKTQNINNTICLEVLISFPSVESSSRNKWQINTISKELDCDDCAVNSHSTGFGSPPPFFLTLVVHVQLYNTPCSIHFGSLQLSKVFHAFVIPSTRHAILPPGCLAKLY